MKVMITGTGIGAQKVISIEDDITTTLVYILSSDNTGGFIRLTNAGVRGLIAALKTAITRK